MTGLNLNVKNLDYKSGLHPRPGRLDIAFPDIGVNRCLSDVPTEALLQFFERAADVSSCVGHVRLATEAEVNCLFDR